ncbi:MAG: molybdopterin-dependent oxidoreductase, partial [Syntrophothermus sp.]
PYATCEDNYIFAKFAKDMGVANLDFQRHFDPEFGDELLRRDDITPNSKGAELAGIRNGVGGFDIEGIINNIKDGKIKIVYLIDDDILSYRPELDEVFNKLDYLIVHASNFNKTSEKANIIFPSSTYAEKNGTMINFEGRIQRLRPAVSVMEKDRSLDLMTVSRMDKFGTDFDRWANKNKKDALPTWKIIANMMNSVGHKYKYDMAENVFNEMVNIIPELDGLDYDIIGDSGINIKSIKEKLHKV